jgi:hypothetical protein
MIGKGGVQDILVGIPRTARRALGGMIVHVLKRENVRDQVFEVRRKGGNTK